METERSWRDGPERLLDGLSLICMLLASICLVTLVATFGWLVFGRYVLNATPTWVEQLALVLVCYIAYLGAAVGIHNNTHLGVTLFRDMLGTTVSDFLKLIIDIVLAAFGFIMLIASIELVQFGWDTMLPMLNVPESVRSFSAALCGGLVFIFAGARAIFRFACLVKRESYVEKGGF